MAATQDLLAQVEPSKRPIARHLLTEITFMRGELGKLRKEIKANGCTELFVQGKQSLTRLSPAFQAYTQLVTRYGQLHKQLTALMPEGTAEQGDELDAFLAELRG